jgi:hypothetical protein
MGHADPIKFANVDIQGAATATLVAAVTGKKIRLHSWFGADSAGGSLRFYSIGAATATLSGLFPYSVAGVAVWPWNGHGWMETAAGAALVVVKTGTATLGGKFSYSEND